MTWLSQGKAEYALACDTAGVHRGNAGSVVNQGRLTAAPGGFIAMVAPVVANAGTITANGSTALAAGDRLTRDFDATTRDAAARNHVISHATLGDPGARHLSRCRARRRARRPPPRMTAETWPL